MIRTREGNQLLNARKAHQPITLREVTIANRIWMSPMCQYSARDDGIPTDWHLVHYGARAVGGVGLILVESTAIAPHHRSTRADLGLWNEQQALAHRRLTSFMTEAGTTPAVQLQCAGRKGSHDRPWESSGQNGAVPPESGGWTPLAPSPIAFGELTTPRQANLEDIEEVIASFAHAAAMADLAGYQAVEIHAGHGYLLHQFLSPLANRRTDHYGGTMENRMRLALRVAESVRAAFPQGKPVFVRITATDWADGGLTIDEAQQFAKELSVVGIDLLDVTSGALLPTAPPPSRAGVNVEFARMLKDASGLPVAPVGSIGTHDLIDDILNRGDSEAVFVGRPLLRDPYFALRLPELDPAAWPPQYHRAL